MSIDDQRLAAALAAQQNRHRAAIVPPGGDAARTTVRRRRRRAVAAVAAGLVLVVAAGLGVLRLHPGEDRLVPAGPRPSASPSARTPGLLDNADVDYGRMPETQCGGPTVHLRDGVDPHVERLGTIFSYSVNGPAPAVGDVDGDGPDDYLAVLQCVGEGGGTGQVYVVLLSGKLPDLTVWAQALYLQAPEGHEPATVDRLDIDEKGIVVIDLTVDGKPGTLRLEWENFNLRHLTAN